MKFFPKRSDAPGATRDSRPHDRRSLRTARSPYDAPRSHDTAIWNLPDMEVGPPEPHPALADHPHRHLFHYEDAHPLPEGAYDAELVGWRKANSHRICWRFHPTDPEHARAAGHKLEYDTGTVCRPDNHLFHLLQALGVLEGDSQAHADPQAHAHLLEDLEPEALIGRRCRVEVEHARDDLGDLHPRIREVRPL